MSRLGLLVTAVARDAEIEVGLERRGGCLMPMPVRLREGVLDECGDEFMRGLDQGGSGLVGGPGGQTHELQRVGLHIKDAYVRARIRPPIIARPTTASPTAK